MTDNPQACPNCQHPQHAPGAECETRVNHSPNHFHACLCLARPGAEVACPPQMTCQGGTLGYADIWYLQRGHSLSGANGETITPDVLKTPPVDRAAAAESVCKFDEGCHRVVPCEPGCGAPRPADRATPTAEAAVERVRSVLESEAVVGRSALDYRGLITSALMADEVAPARHTCRNRTTAAGPDWLCPHCSTLPSRMADEAQQPETQAANRAAVIAEILPAWEAVYEPGNVSDYLIGYANDEAPAKAAAEAWMRSQAEVTGRLEWVPDEQLATGRYDQWFELIERHDDGIDTGPGLIVRRRVADEAQPVCACDPAPHREQDGTYSHWAGCPIADAQQQADGTQGPAPDVVAVIVAALQERAGELSELAEEQMRPSLEERAQEWHEAAEVARKAAAAVSQPGKEA
ncbi:hypothetical protein ACWDBO_31305 [Streptomyces mirabilis]|uniref:hypothetical protein n=1 Tax=Streptomyces mirabilis TaxID=68239 RepID=UPI00331BC987